MVTMHILSKDKGTYNGLRLLQEEIKAACVHFHPPHRIRVCTGCMPLGALLLLVQCSKHQGSFSRSEGGLQELESVDKQQPACRMRHNSMQVVAGLIPPTSRQV